MHYIYHAFFAPFLDLSCVDALIYFVITWVQPQAFVY